MSGKRKVLGVSEDCASLTAEWKRHIPRKDGVRASEGRKGPNSCKILQKAGAEQIHGR
jgi:hypothetical protein